MQTPAQNTISKQTSRPITNDSQSTSTAKNRKGVGGRPKKVLSSPHDPAYKDFLELFGLKSWDDTKSWTQKDLVDSNAIQKYFLIRPKLLKLSYPLNDIRKIKVEDATQLTAKDLITMLNQFGRLYGYTLSSYTKDIKPSKTNGLEKKKCYQVYSLVKIPDAPTD